MAKRPLDARAPEGALLGSRISQVLLNFQNHIQRRRISEVRKGERWGEGGVGERFGCLAEEEEPGQTSRSALLLFPYSETCKAAIVQTLGAVVVMPSKAA